MNKHAHIFLMSTVLAASSFAVSAEDVSARFDDGYFKFKSEDGNFKWKFDGRIMLDSKTISSDNSGRLVNTNTDFRRARFGIKTKFYEDWAGEFDIDFKDNETKVKDMWVAYNGIDHTTIKVGNHKPQFSIGALTSSRWYPLMEDSSIVDFSALGRRIGASVTYWQPSFSLGASVFGGEPGDNEKKDDDDIVEGEKTGYAARAVFRPFGNSDSSRILHFGYNLMSHKPLGADEGDFRVRSRVYGVTLVNENLNSDDDDERVDSIDASSIEIAAKWNKFYLQGEFIDNTISFSESGLADYDVSGYYAEVSYFILGEGRTYNFEDAEFGPVVPEGDSELEFVVRYESFDANDSVAGDDDILEGEFTNLTFGLNWYINTNVILRANYNLIETDEFAREEDDKISIAAMRVEYLF